MTYADKLKDPRWQKMRLEVFNRDEWTCQFCGAKDQTLHIHHLLYQQCDPWECDQSLLKTLCEKCHELEFSVRDQFDYMLITTLKKVGIGAEDICIINSLITNIYKKNKSNTLGKQIIKLLENKYYEMV